MPSLNQVTFELFKICFMVLTHMYKYQAGRLFQQNLSQNLTMIITDSRMTDSHCYNNNGQLLLPSHVNVK